MKLKTKLMILAGKTFNREDSGTPCIKKSFDRACESILKREKEEIDKKLGVIKRMNKALSEIKK